MCTVERVSISATIIRTVLWVAIFRYRQKKKKKKSDGNGICLTWPEGKTELRCNYKVGKSQIRRKKEEEEGNKCKRKQKKYIIFFFFFSIHIRYHVANEKMLSQLSPYVRPKHLHYRKLISWVVQLFFSLFISTVAKSNANLNNVLLLLQISYLALCGQFLKRWLNLLQTTKQRTLKQCFTTLLFSVKLIFYFYFFAQLA